MTDTSQPAEAEAPKKYRKKDAAEIFAVDRRVWAYVCSLGFDAATAYIIMASGTGNDQRTTWWSASAIEKWAGMRWYPANEAITLLKSKGVLHEVARKGSRPGYKLRAAHEIPGLEADIPAGLTSDEQRVMAYLRRHDGTTTLGSAATHGLKIHNAHRIGCALEAKGLVCRVDSHTFSIINVPPQ